MTETINRRKLISCPFCGHEKVTLQDVGGTSGKVYIQCDDCGACTGLYSTHADAMAAWNMRAEGVSQCTE